MTRKSKPSSRARPQKAAKAASSASQAPARASAPPPSAASTAEATAPSARPSAPPPAARTSAPPPRSTPPPPADGSSQPPKASGAAAVAERLVAGEDPHGIGHYGASLDDEREAAAVQAARVIDEVVARKPEMAVSQIDRLVAGIFSKHARVVQTASGTLPTLARIAPARVARHLDTLTGSFSDASPVGKDGLVRTFAALCIASVAYQKRLEPVLDLALGEAEPKTLARWTEIVLPALKGEPHARARAVVERRLMDIPRPVAQQIASFLGIKLRRPV